MRVEIDRIRKLFGSYPALDGLSLAVEPGQIVALLGANGAGKTTLLRCLAGVAAPTAGSIRYDGEEFRRSRIDLRRRLFFLPDTPQALSDMPLIRHVGMVLNLYGAGAPGIEDRVARLLKDLDLLPLAGLPFHMLSRGQAYKGALTAAVAVDPELWLIDEPFASGMDPNGISRFKELARDAARRGRTVIYTTQILDLAELFSDRVIIIDRGRLHAFDSPANLRDASGKTESLEAIFRKLRESKP